MGFAVTSSLGLGPSTGQGLYNTPYPWKTSLAIAHNSQHPAFLLTGSFYASRRLSIAKVAAGSALVVFIMIARYPAAIIIRKLKKKKKGLLLKGPRNYKAHFGLHRGVSGKVNENNAWTCVLLLLGLRVGAQGFIGFFFFFFFW